MRLATYRAASRADQGKDFARETTLARLLCGEKGMEIGSDGVRLLGGHGFVQGAPGRALVPRPSRGRPDGRRAARLMIDLEIPKKFKPLVSSRTPWPLRSSGRTRASTTAPSTSTRRSSTCSPPRSTA